MIDSLIRCSVFGKFFDHLFRVGASQLLRSVEVTPGSRYSYIIGCGRFRNEFWDVYILTDSESFLICPGKKVLRFGKMSIGKYGHFHYLYNDYYAYSDLDSIIYSIPASGAVGS
jgi:hypothetical protein